MSILDSPIDYLKGVGPARAELLKKEINVFTYFDLLTHYPFRYIDKSRIYKIDELRGDMPHIQLKGRVISINSVGIKRSKRLIATFSDDSGTIDLVWFKGINWVKNSIKINHDYIIFGKPTNFSGKFNIVHPEMDLYGDSQQFSGVLQPVYHSTELLKRKGLTSKAISKLVLNLFPLLENQIDENLSADLINRLNLPSRYESLINIHFPKTHRDLNRAKKRLKFDEFFFFKYIYLQQK